MITSKSQLQANKRYREKNREKENQQIKRRVTRSYIRDASKEEFEEILFWIEEKQKEIKKNQ